MLINIRGTSGSGKSTLVRRIKEHYPVVAKVNQEGRKQPIGYMCSARAPGVNTLGLVGHYETDCGGCDTIPSMDQIYDQVKTGHEMGLDVIFEGLLISADLKRTQELHDLGLPLLVVALSTPLDECLASVNARRLARFERQGKPEKFTPVNPKNTESKHKGVIKSMEKMQAHGMNAVWASRDEAYDVIMRALGWDPVP